MTNPITDAFSFLTANTGDFNALGLWKYLILLLFYALLAGSLWLAIDNWRDDPAERNGTALWLWFSRLLIGCMWFQGTLWKLPFGHQNGLWYWTDVILPNFDIVNPLVYFAELGFAISLMLGLFVRLAGVAAALFTLNLWLGIYNQRPGDPAEWPWSYMFLILLCGTFAVMAAGRSLGADAWLRRKVASVRDGRGLGALIRLLT